MTLKGKQGSERTLLRRMTLLDRLPVSNGAGNGPTAQQLTDFLCDNGYPCDKRTVERDLYAMSADAISPDATEWKALGVSLIARRGGGTGGSARRWSHAEASKAQLLNALTREDALLLSLLAQELNCFMPTSASPTLEKLLHASARVLSLPGNQLQSGFRHRIRIIPDGSLLLPPPVNLQHLQEINEALLREEQLDMAYRPAGQEGQKPYRLHPLGLVKQGVFFWLLAIKHENTFTARSAVIQSFRADRIVSVARRVQETVARGLPTLDDAIGADVLKFHHKEMICLRLHFASGAAASDLCHSYREAPLSYDQEITTLADGTLELRATVRDSPELMSMLQEKARLLRVVEPLTLRENIRRLAREAFEFQNDTR
jgi:predicted DNA-binding transcriptional regulator YafY